MRPLILLSSLALGGAERITVSFAKRLAERGEQPVVCTVGSTRDEGLVSELDDAGVERYDLRARRLADSTAVRRYLRLLARQRFDLVHAHGQDASILAAAVRRFTRPPYVVTRHVLDEPGRDWRQSLRARACLGAVRRASARLAVSAAAAERLSRSARIPREAIEVVPNGIEVERFAGPDPLRGRGAIRAALALEEDERVLLLPAALRDGKGHEVLIEALPRVLTRAPNLRVLFAGGGEREGELRERSRPFGQKVLFLGWRRDMAELMAASDVVVLPSFAEAFPTVLMEAAAAGRPVVATRVGGVPEIVAEGETGLVVEPGDGVALGEAVSSLLENGERARALGARARSRARARFSLDAQVDSTLAVWDRVVA